MSTNPPADRVGSVDPLDARLATPSIESAGWWRRQRPAPGLAVTRLPVSALLCMGLAAGPQGTAILPTGMLTAIGPVVAVSLAAVGALIGLHFTIWSRRQVPHVLRDAIVEVGSAVFVGVLLWLALQGELVPVSMPLILIAVAALCSIASAVADDAADSATLPRADGQLGAVVPIVGGGAAILWLAAPTPSAALWLAVNTAATCGAIAIAGAVLIGQAHSESEQRVYLAGVLLVLAGSAIHLGVSPLLVGFAAGALWNQGRSATRERITHDVGSVQHPLIVFLLLGAGASVEWSAPIFVLALIVAVARVVVKMATGSAMPRSLMASGLVGVALALDVHLATDGDPSAVVLLSVCAAAAVIIDLVAIFVTSDERGVEIAAPPPGMETPA